MGFPPRPRWFERLGAMARKPATLPKPDLIPMMTNE
jgi:hypothetical protein